MPLVLFVMGIGCLVLAMSVGGWPLAFVDVPTLVVVILPTSLFAASFHSPSGVLSALRLALGVAPVSADNGRDALAALRTLRSLAWATGFVGFFIGLVQTLANVADPAAIGPAMAVAILSPMYGVIFAECQFRPLTHRLEARIEV